MPFLVSLHNLQKQEFSKESKGKLFFCLIFSTDFFFGVGESQANLRASKRHPWLDIGLQERKKNRSMALLVGKGEGDFVSF